MPDLREAWLRAIRSNEEALPDELEQAVRKSDPKVLSVLQAIADEGGEDGHRARSVLVGLQARTLLATTVDHFESDYTPEEMTDLAGSLAEFLGEAAVDMLIPAYKKASDGAKPLIAEVLARTQVEAEEVLDTLVDCLGRDPFVGAACLSEYGDPEALPALYRALDDNFASGSDAVGAIATAIDELGGTLKKGHRTALRDAAQAHAPPPNLLQRTPTPPRNAPCWCGSGKKYKKCHGTTPEETPDHPPRATP